MLIENSFDVDADPDRGLRLPAEPAQRRRLLPGRRADRGPGRRPVQGQGEDQARPGDGGVRRHRQDHREGRRRPASRCCVAEGKDARGLGHGQGHRDDARRADGDGSSVAAETDLTISGKLAQFGRGIMADVSGADGQRPGETCTGAHRVRVGRRGRAGRGRVGDGGGRVRDQGRHGRERGGRARDGHREHGGDDRRGSGGGHRCGDGHRRRSDRGGGVRSGDGLRRDLRGDARHRHEHRSRDGDRAGRRGHRGHRPPPRLRRARADAPASRRSRRARSRRRPC